MAFEDMTYEVILNRMLSRVSSNYPELDVREGSIIFNALAPAALELAVAYTELDNVLSESFIETASREYLMLACEQVGMNIEQFDATNSIHQGEFNVAVPIGSRWNCDLYNYEVTEYIEQDVVTEYYKYKLRCETTGAAPNTHTGMLSAITDAPSGLDYAYLSECLTEGEDEVSDDKIRSTYAEYVRGTVGDGNVEQYKRWCSEYNGVGNYKIFPLWNGDNTVKVSILSASNKTASQELVDDFQEYLDPGVTGMGDGVAPIGAFVTVSTATEVPINVSANITLKDGYTDTSAIDKAVDNYLSQLAYNKSMVAYMNVGAVIIGVDSVDAIANLTINDGTSDIVLEAEQIPVLGSVTWVVSE